MTLDPNWRVQRVKPTVLDYRHVDYYGDAAPANPAAEVCGAAKPPDARVCDRCDAEHAFCIASEAVAKARGAVVDAARTFVRRGHGPLAESVVVLEEAERAEAEARARLEALR